MGRSDDFDLDFELEKSIEKLIDEETSVAKAFVARTSATNVNYNDEDVINPDRKKVQVNEWKTQVIPELGKRTVSRDDDSEDDLSEEPERVVKPAVSAAKHSKGMDKRTKIAIAAIAAGAVAVIASVVIIAMMITSNEKNTFSYNYSQGMSAYNNGNYSEALTYFEKAVVSEDGRRDVELKHLMVKCYFDIEKDTQAVDMLYDILDDEKYNEKAIVALVEYYEKNKDGAKLTELVRTYAGTNGDEYVRKYILDVPVASVKSGSYMESFELELSTFDGGKVYYTIDNNVPTTGSILYEQAIKVDKGELTIKAISVNDIGVVSEVAEFKYVVDYMIPGEPEMSPASGSYDTDILISIDNLNSGDVAYYTIDGTTPTKESTKYTEPFKLPEGNIIVSVIVINKYNLESNVTKKNYIITKATNYSFAEAKELIITRMKARGDLDENGLMKDKSKIDLVYYTKTEINKDEMFLMYCDVISATGTKRLDYFYGVGCKTGKLYRVTSKDGTYSITEY